MNEEEFKRKIKKKLNAMKKEQVVFFSWLSAIRALPFIGYKGNFAFWTGKLRMKYLYAFFYSLDLIWYNKFPSILKINNIAIGDAARIATRTVDRDVITGAYTHVDTVHSAYATAYAVESIKYSAESASSYVDTVNDAIYAASAASSVYTKAKRKDFYKILLEYSIAILNGQKTFDTHLELYGEVWDNFQQALKNEGCSYWGKVYQELFDNSFEVDEGALKLRMRVPKEIQDQGAAEVANYLENLHIKGVKHLNEARIIILGEKGSGKTCLARRLINPDAPMTNDEESTAGVDTTLWKPEVADINVHIWDFAGHTVTHAVHQFFLSERCLYILVYDGRSEERNRLEYWLNHVKNYGGDSKVFILVNKRDANIPDIPVNSLKENYPVLGVTIFSIRDDKIELEDFRMIVTEYINNNPSWSNQVIPANFFNVKKNLEERFTGEKKDEFIDIDEFVKIAKDNNVENADELLKSLHALGICLRYDNMKDFNTLVLNPEWISQGVYRIINWVHQQGKYSIFLTDFPVVFENDNIRYPDDKHPFLFELMKRYELAYETEKKNCLIIPHLLHDDRPEKLPVFYVGDSLMLRYKADQPLPPDTISRFIVRHNEDIKKEGKMFVVWRYGVVLDDGNGSMALVRELTEERLISVSVKGKDKTAYIDKLRVTLNSIFNSYKSRKPELQYAIERFGQIPDKTVKDNLLWLSDRKIYTHYVNDRPYYDEYTNRDIFLQPVVNNYHISSQNLIMGGQGNLIDSSLRNTFNFHNCNLTLQGHLNDLAGSLKQKGETEEADILEEAAKALSEAEKCKTPEEVKKKGITNKLRRIVEDLEDENSKLSKTVKGIKHGISIAQDIAKGYNDIAQWVGLPQVPKPFLGKE